MDNKMAYSQLTQPGEVRERGKENSSEIMSTNNELTDPSLISRFCQNYDLEATCP
jgi:hypothetical protein